MKLCSQSFAYINSLNPHSVCSIRMVTGAISTSLLEQCHPHGLPRCSSSLDHICQPDISYDALVQQWLFNIFFFFIWKAEWAEEVTFYLLVHSPHACQSQCGSQEPGSQSRFLIWMARTQVPEPSPVVPEPSPVVPGSSPLHAKAVLRPSHSSMWNLQEPQPTAWGSGGGVSLLCILSQNQVHISHGLK